MYLDSFVARINAPRLGDMDITFSSRPTMDASQLGRFVGVRTGIQISPCQADVEASAEAISISISITIPSSSTSLQLHISCRHRQLERRLSSMSQILNQFSLFLFRVEIMGINTTQTEPPSGRYDAAGEQWLELIRAFGGAKDVRLAGVYTKDILCALRSATGGTQPT